MRVLFETNILYSALSGKGVSEDVLMEAARACTLVWARPLRDELESALERRFRLGPGTRAALESFGEICEMIVPAPLPRPVCRDPDDDAVLATAVAGRADYIVTGDEDLLSLKSYQGIRIVSPRRFWEIIAG